MKLLSKNEINAQKSLERKLEIDEGAKLARRVDGLRQTTSTEEVRLETFRKESIAIIEQEIRRKVEERDTLSNEVISLEKRREIALKPIVDEQQDLSKRRDELQQEYRDFLKEKDALKNEKREFERNKQLFNIENDRLADVRIRTKNNNEKAAANLNRSEKMLRDTIDKCAHMEGVSTSKAAELNQYQQQLQARDEALTIREQQANQKEIELQTREVAINDKYQTLTRTIKRIK